MRKFCAAAVGLLLVAGPNLAQAAPPISRPQLEAMFANMRGNTPWNIDGPLLWGYFFTSPDRAALERAGKVLGDKGYHLVEIRRGDQEPATWWLHVERVERHTVDSLDARNAEFYAFAKREGLTSYDGMDVGPPS